MRHDPAGSSGDGQWDVRSAESGLTALLEASERAMEELISPIPPAQLRALLIVEREGGLNLNRLARALGVSASATSRLCDRMQANDLLTRDRAAASRREIVVLPTESGRSLAEWVRRRRRAVLGDLLQAMSPAGREALTRGLCELAAASI